MLRHTHLTRSNHTKALLSGSVPDLQFNLLPVQIYGAVLVIHTGDMAVVTEKIELNWESNYQQ